MTICEVDELGVMEEVGLVGRGNAGKCQISYGSLLHVIVILPTSIFHCLPLA
jgi:hypothetical protein